MKDHLGNVRMMLTEESKTDVYPTLDWEGTAGTGIQYYFIQKEGQQSLTEILDSRDIQKAVADCPQAAAMMNKPVSKQKKEIKKDPAYLNKVFESYNQNCGK